MVRPIKRAAAAVEQAAASAESTALAFKDGVAAELEIDWDEVVKQFKDALTGNLKGKRKMPIRILIDPSYVSPT
jgi:hypothetical protein